ATHEIDAAVAAALSAAFDFLGRSELNMQLTIAELLLRSNRAARSRGDVVLDFPFVTASPRVERFAVEQHVRIARYATGRTRIDHRRLRPHDAAFVFLRLPGNCGSGEEDQERGKERFRIHRSYAVVEERSSGLHHVTPQLSYEERRTVATSCPARRGKHASTS